MSIVDSSAAGAADCEVISRVEGTLLLPVDAATSPPPTQLPLEFQARARLTSQAALLCSC